MNEPEMQDQVGNDGQPQLKPRFDAVIRRLIGMEAGETVTLQPFECFTSEQYRDEIRRLLGERPEVERRTYHFTTTRDRLVTGWTPYRGVQRQELPSSGKSGKRDWSEAIARAMLLKDGESCEFTVPDDDDVQKYKTNLLTTLGYNSAQTKAYRWGVANTKGERKLIVTRHGLRVETPAPVRPQNMPRMQPDVAPSVYLSPPIDIPVVRLEPQEPKASPAKVSSDLSLQNAIGTLERRAEALQAEIQKIRTAIEVLQSIG